MIRRLGCGQEPDVSLLRAQSGYDAIKLAEPVLGACDSDAYRRVMIARMHVDSRAPTGARRDNKAEWLEGLSMSGMRQG